MVLEPPAPVDPKAVARALRPPVTMKSFFGNAAAAKPAESAAAATSSACCDRRATATTASSTASAACPSSAFAAAFPTPARRGSAAGGSAAGGASEEAQLAWAMRESMPQSPDASAVVDLTHDGHSVGGRRDHSYDHSYGHDECDGDDYDYDEDGGARYDDDDDFDDDFEAPPRPPRPRAPPTAAATAVAANPPPPPPSSALGKRPAAPTRPLPSAKKSEAAKKSPFFTPRDPALPLAPLVGTLASADLTAAVAGGTPPFAKRCASADRNERNDRKTSPVVDHKPRCLHAYAVSLRAPSLCLTCPFWLHPSLIIQA